MGDLLRPRLDWPEQRTKSRAFSFRFKLAGLWISQTSNLYAPPRLTTIASVFPKGKSWPFEPLSFLYQMLAYRFKFRVRSLYFYSSVPVFNLLVKEEAFVPLASVPHPVEILAVRRQFRGSYFLLPPA